MLAKFRSFLRGLAGRERFEDGLSDEMRFHIDAYTDDLVRSGVSPQEARRRAAIEFGSVERVRQECRESRGLSWPDELARNTRYAIRVLRKSPGFTFATVITLALCIGANTAIFSVIDAALLRPLPYPEPERLTQVITVVQWRGQVEHDDSQDGTTWEMLRDHSRYADYAVASGGWTGVNIATRGQARYVAQSRVSAGYFRVLGVPPALGREFTQEEDREGGPPAVILSHELWIRLFNGDSSAIGRTVLLRGEPHTIAGVMPAGFRPVSNADLWTPVRPSTTGEGGGTNYAILARVHPDATLQQADAEVRALGQRLLERRKTPADVTAQFGLVSLQRAMAFEIAKPLYVLWAAVGVVLLIGCLNIAGLLLVRSSGRTREMATRIALGGGKGAVVRQLLTESLVIALAGGMLGVGLGYAGIRALSVLANDALDVWQELRLDWRVLLMTLGVSVLTSILFGLLPALRAARIDLRAGLTEGGSRGIAGATSRWPRRLLVAGEIAMSMMLLVGAGLLIRTFLHLRELTAGFDGRNVLAASLSLQDARYATTAAGNRLFTESLERIRALPGVESAAVALHVPYERWLNDHFTLPAKDGSESKSTITSLNYITPGFFRTLRIQLIAGRDFDERDNAEARPVAIVNQAFARQYLKGREPLGTAALAAGKKAPRVIVGVVGDVQQRSGWGDSGPLAPMPAMYIPAAQMPDAGFRLVHTWFAPKWVIRAMGSRELLEAGMRRAVEQTDPLLPFASFKTLDDVRDQTLSHQRLQAALLGTLATLALVLAAVGIYGLIANSVAQRAREIGIRMALGASVARAVATIAVPGIALAVASVAAGCLLSLASVRVLRSSVFGISTLDPITFAGVAALLLSISVLASVVPALRVTRLNAADTLRDE